MDGLLNPALYRLLDLIGFMFKHEWFPPFVILPLMLVSAAIVRFAAAARTKPYIAAARERVVFLRQLLGDEPDPVADRATFHSKFLEISRAMSAAELHTAELAEAWREFDETLIKSGTVIENTTRPSSFFLRVIPKQTSLTFWSNIFVGLGLILTFLGLIIALNTAAQNMGGSAAAAQGALKGLLDVAGAKFFSSVAGLAASIWLRSVEHDLTRKATAPTIQICSLLERGMKYVSSQALAQSQLEVMKEQREQLLTFNTDFALQLSERIGGEFQRAMTPVAQSLDNLNQNMTSVTKGIGAGAAEAIEKVSGDQLKGLAETLQRLNDKLDNIGTAVDSSGEAAANKINEAGEKFAAAALGIQAAFETLTANVGSLGTNLQAQGDAAAEAQAEALRKLMAGMEATRSETATMIQEAVKELAEAAQNAAGGIQAGVDSGINTGIEAGSKKLAGAITDASQGISDVLGQFAGSISRAANEVDNAGGKFLQSAEGAGRSASAMSTVAGQAERTAAALGNASEAIGKVTEPMAVAARETTNSVAKMAGSLDAYNLAQARALDEMKELASGVRQTHLAAETGWRDYRARFEGVDQALGKSVETITACLNDFRLFAQDIDRELANAVSKLGQVVEPMSDYAESLDEFVDAQRTKG